MLHFAYGSNMDRAVMAQMLRRMRRRVGPARLADLRFGITADGYASVAPAPGEVVHGVLWRLTPRDLAAARTRTRESPRALSRRRFADRCPGWRRRQALVYIAGERAAGRAQPGYRSWSCAAARSGICRPIHSRPWSDGCRARSGGKRARARWNDDGRDRRVASAAACRASAIAPGSSTPRCGVASKAGCATAATARSRRCSPVRPRRSPP